jgi:dihydropteroate synthase
VQSKLFSVNKTLNLKSTLLDISMPKVMGILNVTPDSFFEGSRHAAISSLLKQAEAMLQEGAAMLDVGGYSSRPNATHISEEEELTRVIPAVEALSKEYPTAIISIDTFRSNVAAKAIEGGAAMINDISAGKLDAAMIETVARLGVPYIAMHIRGTPQNMNQLTGYENLLKDIANELAHRLVCCVEAGIKDVIIDPGFGFAKTVDQNFELLNNLDYLRILGKPLLVGLSRKSMIWRTLNTTADQALNGTTALNTVALLKGASILRVHDVKEAVETIKLVQKL